MVEPEPPPLLSSDDDEDDADEASSAENAKPQDISTGTNVGASEKNASLLQGKGNESKSGRGRKKKAAHLPEWCATRMTERQQVYVLVE